MLEYNSVRARTGTYVKSSLDCVRIEDLESIDYHIAIIDVKGTIAYRIIIMCRSF
jgi:hypothetical protein